MSVLVAFTYSFEHKKSYEGLMRLVTAGQVPDLVVAAGFKKLGISHSPTRVSPQGLRFPTAREVCERFSVEYMEVDHDSPELIAELAQRSPSVGVILGARILKDKLISAFTKGIINLHPGVLPENRGLDNLKWAITRGLPQGVTSHLIDSKIDRGALLKIRLIDVYEDDSLLDVFLRIQNLEMEMLPESIKSVEATSVIDLESLGVGEYHGTMDAEMDRFVVEVFPSYKANYTNILKEYELRRNSNVVP
ncbi:MAG: hypothetical protein KF772_02065 [Cryobacterium sp.]|nr:hypothetical protein [Cryobacterium sp.]